jgi:hypothetical protein
MGNMINIFNPNYLIIHGGNLNWEGYLDESLKSCKENSLKLLYDDCKIIVSKKKNMISLGACLSNFKEYENLL